MENINVGITEMHGIAQEYSKFPPEGVVYSEVFPNDKYTKRIFRSAAKGVYAYVNAPNHDIIEAPLFPVLTNQPLIYTPAHFSSAGAFDFFGVPTPRFIKMMFAKRFLERDNFKKLIFKSEFGRKSLLEYGGIDCRSILDKTDVIYPCIRPIPDTMIEYRNNKINLLFVGEFLRKGGANVVDAFLRLNQEFDDLTLTICSSRSIQSKNTPLINEYLKKIDNCKNITMEFVDRERLIGEIIPQSDIYLCPTYQESWGFSIQEAMAYGRAVIATDISAIPEMIENNKSGILIPIKDHPFIKKSKGYIVNDIPDDFMNYLTEEVYKSTKRLIEDISFRKSLGQEALRTSRTKFCIDKRKSKILKIYKDALNSR